MEFEELEEYLKDIKRLTKKFRTLPEDIETLKKVLEAEPDAVYPRSYRISGMGLESNIIKVKRVACKSLKGKGSNTGLRLIYAYEKEEQKIILTELYFKGDKENEDRERIEKYFK
jgi:hypothetical protein